MSRYQCTQSYIPAVQTVRESEYRPTIVRVAHWAVCSLLLSWGRRCYSLFIGHVTQKLLLNREKVKYFCSTYRELCDEYHREIIHHVNIFFVIYVIAYIPSLGNCLLCSTNTLPTHFGIISPWRVATPSKGSLCYHLMGQPGSAISLSPKNTNNNM